MWNDDAALNKVKEPRYKERYVKDSKKISMNVSGTKIIRQKEMSDSQDSGR